MPSFLPDTQPIEAGNKAVAVECIYNVPATVPTAPLTVPHSILTTTLKGVAEQCLQDRGPHSPNFQNCLPMAPS